MLRTLAAQAIAIWPQEQALIARYQLPVGAKILDIGCGTGEISARLLELIPQSHLIGVDLDRAHLDRARQRCTSFADRAEFRVADAVELDVNDGPFDLTVCRHLLQAVPSPSRVVANMARLTRPGGRIHVVAEDYAMMHFWPTQDDMDEFWRRGPIRFASVTGTDLRSGRKMFHVMSELGLRDVRVDMLCIDTIRVNRETFAEIWIAWRDGYAEAISEHTELTVDEVTSSFNQMIECILNPKGYAVWQLPVISARV